MLPHGGIYWIAFNEREYSCQSQDRGNLVCALQEHIIVAISTDPIGTSNQGHADPYRLQITGYGFKPRKASDD